MVKEEPTVYEVMATAVAHELRDDERWFIGLATGEKTRLLLQCVPLVGMALAQHTHAPNSTMVVAGWIHNPVVSEIPTRMESEYGTELRDWKCEAQTSDGGSPICYRRGDIDVGFGSAAQVDKYGNCNIVCIGDYRKPKVRLIGPIFQPGHFSLFGREIVILDHEKRNFVEKVDYISGVGYPRGPSTRERLGLIGSGPCMVLTDKAIFGFDKRTKLIRLRSIHPGVTVEQVRENTGFTHDYIPKRVTATKAPTPEELRIIRGEVDPRGVLLPR